MFGQSSGGTAILALLASPLARGLFQRAWLASASPILNKTATDAFRDNKVFVRNTGCLTVSCLYNLSAEEVVDSIPWNEYPYWNMSADQNNLPTKGLFIGALAIVDGSVWFSFFLIYLFIYLFTHFFIYLAFFFFLSFL